jgi:hypothetical protein
MSLCILSQTRLFPQSPRDVSHLCQSATDMSIVSLQMTLSPHSLGPNSGLQISWCCCSVLERPEFF